MSTLADHHKVLKNGKGKCSVPMWSGGCPSGFCDRDAFGKYIRGPEYAEGPSRGQRIDGKYSGYVPSLACQIHGGPECPGVEIEKNVFSGCDQSAGDCPTCGH